MKIHSFIINKIEDSLDEYGFTITPYTIIPNQVIKAKLICKTGEEANTISKAAKMALLNKNTQVNWYFRGSLVFNPAIRVLYLFLNSNESRLGHSYTILNALVGM